MKGPIGRLASITIYVAPVANPFEPPSEAAAGAVVRSVRIASKVMPVSRTTTAMRHRAQRLRITRIRVRRAPTEPPKGA